MTDEMRRLRARCMFYFAGDDAGNGGEDVRQHTATPNGYNPLLEDFTNTKLLLLT